MTEAYLAISQCLISPIIEYVSEENAEIIWGRIRADYPNLTADELTRRILTKYIKFSKPAVIELLPINDFEGKNSQSKSGQRD